MGKEQQPPHAQPTPRESQADPRECTPLPPSGDVFVAQTQGMMPCMPAPGTAMPIAIQEAIIAEINDALNALEHAAADAESVAAACEQSGNR